MKRNSTVFFVYSPREYPFCFAPSPSWFRYSLRIISMPSAFQAGRLAIIALELLAGCAILIYMHRIEIRSPEEGK